MHVEWRKKYEPTRVDRSFSIPRGAHQPLLVRYVWSPLPNQPASLPQRPGPQACPNMLVDLLEMTNLDSGEPGLLCGRESVGVL